MVFFNTNFIYMDYQKASENLSKAYSSGNEKDFNRAKKNLVKFYDKRAGSKHRALLKAKK